MSLREFILLQGKVEPAGTVTGEKGGKKRSRPQTGLASNSRCSVYENTLEDIWDIPIETDVVSSRPRNRKRPENTHEYGTSFLYRVQSSPYLRAHLASSRALRCSSIVAWKTG